MQTYKNWEAFEEETRRFSKNLETISNPQEATKAFLQASSKYTILAKNNSSALQLDFLNGTLTVTPGILVNAETGKSAFNLVDLIGRPADSTAVVMNKKSLSLKNSELLNVLLDSIKKQFNLPEDFGENLLYLIQNRDRFVNELMLSSSKALVATWKEYRETDLVRQQAKLAAKSIVPHKKREITELLSKGESSFFEAIQALQKGNDPLAKASFATSHATFQEALNRSTKLLGIPVDVILEEFKYD